MEPDTFCQVLGIPCGSVRASRLVSLLLLLQTRGHMTAPDLARELEVSVRTVYRDVEALSGAGVPVYSEAGRGGGFRLVEGYRTRLTGLSAREAEALLIGGTPGPVGELGLGTVFAAAQAKLLAALPKEVADRAFLVRQRFHLDSAGWFRPARVPPHLGAVATAVWEERRLEIVYRHPGSEEGARRVLDPLGLVLKAGVWYLVAARDGQLDRRHLPARRDQRRRRGRSPHPSTPAPHREPVERRGSAGESSSFGDEPARRTRT